MEGGKAQRRRLFNLFRMANCREIRDHISLYLDDELQGSERVGLENHLKQCEACRSRFERERRFLEAIRQSKPLHTASDELHSRVEEILSTTGRTNLVPTRLRLGIKRSLANFTQTSHASVLSVHTMIAVAAVLLMVLFLGLWTVSRDAKRSLIGGPSEFALMAADTHLRHIRGQLPLEINAGAPEQISAWFHDKLPFSVKLPNYQESSGQKKLYDLEGARLVGFKSDYAAYVAYQMEHRPISLVITSNQVAQPSGGEEITAKGLTFHYDSIDGFKVLTWSDRGLTYALVSDLEERGQRSCVVCHDGSKDNESIAPLKPKT